MQYDSLHHVWVFIAQHTYWHSPSTAGCKGSECRRGDSWREKVMETCFEVLHSSVFPLHTSLSLPGQTQLPSTSRSKGIKNPDLLLHTSKRHFPAISSSTTSTWLDMIPDVAVGQSPALLQQQPFLWAELHVEISAISSVDMDQQWRLSQTLHRHCMKQCHWHQGTILQRETDRLAWRSICY